MAEKMSPCPFCNHSGPFDQWPCEWLDATEVNVIRCPMCHGAAPVSTWNRRHLAQPAQAVDVGTAYVQAMVQVHEAKNHAIGNAQAAGWRDIATAPETGVFLVHLEAPMMGSLVHSANWRPNVKTIGAIFSFDAPKATHWMPLPTPPTQDTPNAHE